LWIICKTFHILPNDPLLAKLQPLQISWILSNLRKDAEEVSEATSKLGKEVQKFELDEDTFKEMIKNLKK
jgi:hypothetical protein